MEMLETFINIVCMHCYLKWPIFSSLKCWMQLLKWDQEIFCLNRFITMGLLYDFNGINWLKKEVTTTWSL